MTSIAVSTNGVGQNASQLEVEFVKHADYPKLKEIAQAWSNFASQQKQMIKKAANEKSEPLELESEEYNLFSRSDLSCFLISVYLGCPDPHLIYRCIDKTTQIVEGIIVLEYLQEESPNTIYVEQLASNPKNLPTSSIHSTTEKVRGAGSALLRYAEEVFIQKKGSLSGLEEIHLEALTGSLEFYKNRGFTEIIDENGIGTQKMYKRIDAVFASSLTFPIEAIGD